MSAPKPVFIVGNKRSGSTLLVNMLNEHPAVGITHESDVIWILFQCRHLAPRQFRCFPLDAPRGMDAVLDAYGDAINHLSSSPESQLNNAFYDIQKKVLEQGTRVHVPLKKTDGLLWLGDKKPVQHASPEICAFIRRQFPDARFIHVIRHPKGVIASKMEAARTWPVVPAYWNGSAAEVLEQWCVHEDWVLDIKALNPGRVHTVRLEDLIERPAQQMAGLFAFLELDTSEALRARMVEYVYKRPNGKYEQFTLPDSARAKRIIEAYNYAADETAIRVSPPKPQHGDRLAEEARHAGNL